MMTVVNLLDDLSKENKEVKNRSDIKVESIKLSALIRAVLELKALAIYPHASLARDKFYNRLNYVENLLLKLKDVNVELERDWWEE